jgi:glycosyltransferase involved in cell wall biosynthesis
MKVSIITPAYNQGKFLAETIESVLRQDYPEIEYLVIDDGSTDNTPDVVRPYLDRLRYIRHENIGETRTVNKGYQLSSGDLVGVVNADDPLFEDNAVSSIVWHLEESVTAVAAYPDWVSIDQDGNVLEFMRQPDYNLDNMLATFNVTLGPGMFIKKSVLEVIGWRNEALKYTGDLDLSFRLALEGELAHVPLVLATHRVHSMAASSTAQGERMALEVLRLATLCLASPRLPQKIRRQKNEILSRAHYVASKFSGREHGVRLALLGKSLAYGLISPGWWYTNVYCRCLCLISPGWWCTKLRTPGRLLWKCIPSSCLDGLRGVVRRNLPMPLKKALAKILQVFGLVE